MARHLPPLSLVDSFLRRSLPALAALCLVLSTAHAQNFRIERFQQAGAGGRSESGSFTLYSSAGTVSPSGETSGGPYSATSGGRLVVQEPIAKLAVIHSPAATADEQADLLVMTEVDATFGVREALLHYRRGGDTQFTAVNMERRGASQFEAAIPGTAVTSRGVAYFLMVTDSTGRTSRGPSTGFHAVAVRVAEPGLVLGDALPGGADQTAYSLISVPLNLENKDPEAVLADDFGTYDPTQWRFFEMAFDESVVEYPNTNEMTLGTAFWLIAREPGNVFDTGAGVSARLDRRFSMAVHPRWNLIGNPFDFPIPAGNVTLGSQQQVELRSYERGWNNPIRDRVTELQPFSGYAAFNPSSVVDTLYVNPNLPATANASMKKGVRQLDEVAWALQITGRDRTSRDADNVAAVASNAATGWDAMDYPEPPSMGSSVAVYFPHPEWGRLSDHYSTDVRSNTLDGHEWTFEVKSDSDEPVRLGFDGVDDVPSDLEVWLVDNMLAQPKDLRTDPSYAFNPAGVAAAREFRLVVGSRTYVNRVLGDVQTVPSKFELFPVFPNPFGTSTTIRYALPRPTHVTVRIFSVAGNLVAVLADRTEPEGYHSLVWEGHGMHGNLLPSGLYFVRLQAGDRGLGETVVLVR